VQKAVAAVEAVEALVAQEAEKAKLRQREQRLAAELAKVRAELKGDRRATSSAEKVPCPECGDPVVNSPSGLGVHRGRSKKHRAAQ
jgi:DNA repair exonuclease SbcCD ATPase subunit